MIVFSNGANVFGESNSSNILEDAIEKLEDKEFELALELFDKILELEPNNITALNSKANIVMELGNTELALELFDKILELEPNHVETLNNKGILLAIEGDPITGLEFIFDAYFIDPNNIITIDNIKKLEKFTPFVRENGVGKIIIRNGDGNLIGYTESSKINVHYPLGLEFLEKFCSWSEIERNGIMVNNIECASYFFMEEYSMYSKTELEFQGPRSAFKAVTLEHDSFLSEPGDLIEVKLNIFRPISLN